MYVDVVQNVFEIEKQTNKRNASVDRTILGSETAPLKRRKQEGNEICVLPYCFDKRGDSR